MQVLFTGLGSIGTRHARLLAERPESIELLAYRSGHARGGEPSVDVREFTDLNRALAAEPDIVFVTNPTNRHVETALRCAAAGCHLFIEKPLSHSMANVDELVSTVERRDVITMVGCQLRFDPVLQRLKELLDAETLGEVHSFRAYSGSYLPEWRPDQDYRTSYSADPDRGGGVVLDLVHELDYAYWLFGSPERVESELSTVDSLDIESEAVAEIMLRTNDGTVGNVHLDYCRRRPRRTFEAICEAGVVTADLLDGELTIERPASTDTETFTVERDDRFRSQLAYFLDHVERGEPCQNDVRTARDVLEVATTVKEDFDE